MKLTDQTANAIIRAFRNHKRVCDLPQPFVSELMKRGYVPLIMRVTTWLYYANKQASDALWENKDALAIQYMRKQGFAQKNRTTMPKRSEHYIRSGRDSGKLSAPAHDWKYVK